MTPTQWEAIEEVINRLAVPEKLELIERIAHSLRSEARPDTAEQKRAALERLRAELIALPASPRHDGLSGRDHDRILYGGGV